MTPLFQGPSLQTLAMSTRAVLHQIETLTYNITENEKEVLTDLNSSLRKLYSSTYNRLPNKDGLALRPRDQRQVDAECGRPNVPSDVQHYQP